MTDKNSATLYRLEVLLTLDGRVVADTASVDLAVLRKVLDAEEIEDANSVCHLIHKFSREGGELVNKLMNEGSKV